MSSHSLTVAPKRLPQTGALLLLVVALVAAACGGSDDSGSNSIAAEQGEPTAVPAPDEPASAPDTGPETQAEAEPEAGTDPAVELTASFRGVTADTITLGFSMLDFDTLKELNLAPQGWGDQQLVYQSFVDDLNARGGINGRMVEPVYRFYSPLGATEAEAACLELTDDNETFAVIGGFLGPAEVANTCIVGPQETILIGGRQSPERLAQADAPWFETGASRARRLELFLQLLGDEGMLEGRTIALIGGIQATEDYEYAGELLDQMGIEPAVDVLISAADGDIPAVDAEWASVSEAVRSAGVDTALVVGTTSGNIRGLRNNGLTAEDVEIWAVDNDGLSNLGESVDPDWANGTLTLQSLGDIEGWDDATVAECRRVFAAANPDIEIIGPEDVVEGDERWFTPIMSYCRWLRMFELIATEAGPELTQDSFREAAYRLGDFELPAQPFNSLGPDKPDASDSFRLGIYDSSLGARGEVVKLTEIVDVTP